jgi:hypothetical protein
MSKVMFKQEQHAEERQIDRNEVQRDLQTPRHRSVYQTWPAAKLRLEPPRLGRSGSASLPSPFLQPRYAGARNLQGALKTCFIYCESRP